MSFVTHLALDLFVELLCLSKKYTISNPQNMDKHRIALTFYDMGVVKFGKFQLKSGIISPIYVDLRILISSPKFMDEIAQSLISLLPTEGIDLICGVPYSALPIATCISVRMNIPMVMCRKEAKSYGTKQMIEGIWENEQNCAIIEDVVTSGSSVSSVAQLLRQSGISTEHAVIIIDREQGGPNYLRNQNMKVTSLFTLTELLNILHQENRITKEQFNESITFIHGSLTFEIPSELKFTCSQLHRLHQIIKSKQSRLCVAIDISDPIELLQITNEIGSEICALKLHLDILQPNTNPDMIIQGLRELSMKHGFLIVEDRKLADIGQTVYKQLLYGVYRIAEWCDIITVHCLPGSSLFDAFRKVNQKLLENEKHHHHEISALVVVEMSCQGALTTDAYKDHCTNLIKTNSDIIAGFVAQHPIIGLNSFSSTTTYWVPGIKLINSSDDLGQNYNTPEQVNKRFAPTSSSVVMIVGRGITESKNIHEEAMKYRLASIQ
ncbi:hypothetical protein MN116_006457 [Schistosoma mekongi]|uniref:Uridine 5'-monophosphate synthase n=1 Tax=Schistosoma mekongi TaxID=38744 RepID=A0AAE2D4F8_SCHME|nr:hypothetical protein MN116_006457 [Schistosoma mekongi]